MKMETEGQLPHIDAVEVPRPHVLRLYFDDGLVREVELVTGCNRGSMFEPLEDPAYFRRVRVDPETRTVVWPNGLDLDPAVLHGDDEPAGERHFQEVARSPGRAAG